MPVIKTWSPLSAAVDLAAGYSQQKKTNQEDALNQQLRQSVVNSQLADAAQRSHLTQLQIDAGQTAANQQEHNRQFESRLVLPTHWSKMSPKDQMSYLQRRMDLAQAAGDQQLVQQTQDEINSIGLTEQRFANAAYTSGARTNLTEAQAQNAKGLYQQQLQLLDRKGAVQMASLYARFRNEALHTGMTEAEAENRAAAAAMNAMERTVYGAQIRGALDQYNQSQINYRRTYDPATGTYGSPQPSQTFVMPQAPPVIIMTPNGPQAVSAQPQPKSAQPAPKAKPSAPAENGWKGFGIIPTPTGHAATRTGRIASKPGSPTLYEYSDGSWRPQ